MGWLRRTITSAITVETQGDRDSASQVPSGTPRNTLKQRLSRRSMAGTLFWPKTPGDSCESTISGLLFSVTRHLPLLAPKGAYAGVLFDPLPKVLDRGSASVADKTGAFLFFVPTDPAGLQIYCNGPIILDNTAPASWFRQELTRGFLFSAFPCYHQLCQSSGSPISIIDSVLCEYCSGNVCRWFASRSCHLVSGQMVVTMWRQMANSRNGLAIRSFRPTKLRHQSMLSVPAKLGWSTTLRFHSRLWCAHTLRR